MDLAEIASKHVNSIIDAAPVQKIMGFVIFSIVVFSIKFHNDDVYDFLANLTIRDIFTGDSSLLGELDLFVVVTSFFLLYCTSIGYGVFRKKIFYYFSKEMECNSSYSDMLEKVKSSTVPLERYREIRVTFKDKRKIISVANWHGEFVFYIAICFFMLTFYKATMFLGFLFSLSLIYFFEKRHFELFILECLPLVLILREKFGARDTKYPY